MQQSVGVVGVIGLGAMGLPIACRLARAGFRLAAFDTDARAVEATRAEGEVQTSASPAAVAEASEVLITCLPHPQIVEAVYREVARPGLLACDCSRGCASTWRRRTPWCWPIPRRC